MPQDSDIDSDGIDKLVLNREAFNKFVYTPIDRAIKELHERWDDKNLEDKINKLLDNDVPAPFKKGFISVLLRHLITPNYEIRRFLHLTDMTEEMKPLLAEYADDKFVPSNKSKRFLGKTTFYLGRDKNGCIKTEKIDLINFENAKNKKISGIETLWGENLVDFHHSFFSKTCKKLKKEEIFNISSWYHNHGPSADKYYFYLLILFIRNGLMFENFVLEDKDEKGFIKEVFLPAFMKVIQVTGKKPLIVALEPTEIEGDKFWFCYPNNSKTFVEYKASSFFKRLWLKLPYEFRYMRASARR